MNQQTNAKVIERLKSLIPINNLSEHDIELIAGRSKFKSLQENEILFKEGQKDNYLFYLLNGELAFTSNSSQNKPFNIISGKDDARYPLAQFQPRQYTAKIIKKSSIMLIDRALLDTLLIDHQAKEDHLDDMPDFDLTHNDEDWMLRIVQTPLYTNLSVEIIQKILGKIEAIDVKANEIVVNQGDEGHYYYIIQQGRCEISRKPNPESPNIHIAYLRSGDAFGEESIITNLKRSASVTMLSHGRIMRLAKEYFKEFVLDQILKQTDIKSAYDRIEQGATLLDVRYPDEYKEYSIKNSSNIPLDTLRKRVKDLDDSKQYITCCDTGIRSKIAAYVLAQHGYDVFHLDIGLKESYSANKKYFQGNDKPQKNDNVTTLPTNAVPPPTTSAIPAKQRGSNPSDHQLAEEVAYLREELELLKVQLSKNNQLHSIPEQLKQEVLFETEQWIREQGEKINQQVITASNLIQQAYEMYKAFEQESQPLLQRNTTYPRQTDDSKQTLNAPHVEQEEAEQIPEKEIFTKKTKATNTQNDPVSTDLKQWIFEQAADSLSSVNNETEIKKRQMVEEADKRRSEKADKVSKKYQQELKTAKLRDYKLLSDIDTMLKKPDN